MRSHMRFLSSAIIMTILCFGKIGFTQELNPVSHPDVPDVLKDQYAPLGYQSDHISRKPGHNTITDWDEAIDNTWGWGLPTSQKIQVLNRFWDLIDTSYACFVNHPDYYPGWWDSIKAVYLDEINNGDPTYGVSRGRFAAMMNYMSMALRDSHTRAWDIVVNENTALAPGVPLLVPGPYGPNNHFGAGLTPLADSSLLVYKTVANHPLGLVPGDIVLGYDGVPWKTLYKDLLAEQIPVYFGLGWGNRWGSSASAFAHSWLTSAGMNWHLFDSLDVVKYSTGDTIRISVSPLVGQNMELYCTEQIEIPGVPMPDLGSGERSSYGVMEGTQIGYIYIWSWSENIEEEFHEAVYTLMNHYQTTGLIIDLRFDYWGYMHLANRGFKYLYNTNVPLVEWLKRCSPDDHLSLCPSGFTYFTELYGSPLTYYDRPIAVLTASGSFSVGDYIALAIEQHPMTRIFGKPVTGAFNSFNSQTMGSFKWTYSNDNTHRPDFPDEYMMRMESPVDEEVWLMPDDVAYGHDTVVEAAESWMNSQQGMLADIVIDLESYDVAVDYGQTLTRDLLITNNGTKYLFFSLTPECDNQMAGIDLKPKYDSIITDHGGPDNFGYIWIDSEQPHGPEFDWNDISAEGTPVSLGDDSYVGPIDIGFDFPFYGNSYSQLYICSNGLITFGAGTTDYANVAIPDANSPNNFIAPWWDNLRPNAGGHVYYYYDIDSNRFIVSFVGVPKYLYGGHTTFQVILNSNGEIQFNYVNMELGINAFNDFYSATIGIENSDGTDGLEIYANAPYTIDSLSILITTDWLAVAPFSGYIAPGENELATVTFNAQHLYPGHYTGNIYLDSNDPVESSIVIPVTLTVEGPCLYLAGDANMYSETVDPGDSLTGPWRLLGDVSFLVNYFNVSSGLQPCLMHNPNTPDQPGGPQGGYFFASADVTGDCIVAPGDISRLVQYFAFNPAAVIRWCGWDKPDPQNYYPPMWLVNRGSPGPQPVPPLIDLPVGWPNCQVLPPAVAKAIPTDPASK